MPNITFTSTDYLDSVDTLVSYLQDSGFSGTLEKGSANYDILVKGMSLLYSMFKKEASKTEAYLSLNKAKEFKTLLGDEYDLVVDSILSNWFITRDSGSPTTGSVKLFFSKPVDYLVVSPDTTELKISDVVFIPDDTYRLSSSDFTAKFNDTTTDTEYFVSFSVRSKNSGSYTVLKGAEVVVDIASEFYSHAEADIEFTPGVEEEDSDSFITRVEDDIKIREALSEKAISSTVTTIMPDVYEVYVSGYGHPEQSRDTSVFAYEPNSTTANTFLVGNHSDIYIKPEYTITETTFDTYSSDNSVFFPKESIGPLSYRINGVPTTMPAITGLYSSAVPYSLERMYQGTINATNDASNVAHGVHTQYFGNNSSYETMYANYANEMNLYFTGFDKDITYTELLFMLAGSAYNYINNASTYIWCTVTDLYSGVELVPATQILLNPVRNAYAVEVTGLQLDGKKLTDIKVNLLSPTTVIYFYFFEFEMFLKTPNGVERYYGERNKAVYIQDPALVDGGTVSFTMAKPSDMSNVESKLLETNRVLCYNPTLKAKYPIAISGTLSIDKESSYLGTDADIDSGIRDALYKYCKGIKQGDTFNVSEALKEIHNNVPGIKNIASTFNYAVLDLGTNTQVTGTITDSFSFPTLSSTQISWNTTQFVADTNEAELVITIN